MHTDTPDHGLPSTLEISLRGSDPFVWQGDDKAPGETNYFIGNDSSKWRTHVARYGRAETLKQHGVQLAIHGSNYQDQSAGKGIEYDVHTDAGVDPARLRFEFKGARKLRIDRGGNLLMLVGDEEIRMQAPVIYEQVSATAQGSRRKTTSSPRSRKSTSSHSSVRGAHRETMPRKSTRGSSDPANRRLRKSMHDYPHAPRKRVRKRTPTTLPLGDQSGGSKAANLVIADSASNSSQTVALVGTGTQAASIQVAPSSLTFAVPESVGAQSAAQIVTITNEGTIPALFTSDDDHWRE